MRVINTAVALTYKKKLIEIYGDLALLTSKYNVPKQRKKKRLCIIPHYVDFENEVIQEYKEIFQDEIEICTLSNKSAQLELNLSFLLELSIKKYICTTTTKKNLSEGSQQRISESLLKDIRRNTKRIFTSEQKGLIVMGGIRGEHSIAELCRKYLCKKYNIKHIHGKPLHPQTQGKIKRYHRSMKNVIKLNHYFSPSELEKVIDGWVEYYN